MANLNTHFRIYKDPLYDYGSPGLVPRLNKTASIEYDEIDETWYCETCQLAIADMYEMGGHKCSSPYMPVMGQGNLFNSRLDFNYLKRAKHPDVQFNPGWSSKIGDFTKFVMPIIRPVKPNLVSNLLDGYS